MDVRLFISRRYLRVVRVQKVNGVKLIEGNDSATKAAEFVAGLATAIREHLSNILGSAAAFSVLSDGSQARKTGSEKELIYVRTSRAGNPEYYLVHAISNK